MNRKLRAFTALVAVASVTASLAACGTSKTNAVEEVIWYMTKPLDNMSAQSMVEDEVNNIIEKEIGAKLRFNLIDVGSWTEKMNIVINSGEKFDIMITATGTATSVVTNAKRGTFMDIGPLLDKYGADIKAKVDPRAWEGVTYDGKVLVIPAQAKWVQDMGYVFKKDLVDKYNFDYKSVKSLKDLEPYFDILLKNEPGIVPCYAIYEAYNGRFAPTDVPGVVFDEEREKYVNLLEAKMDEYRLKHEWYKKGYIAADTLSRSGSGEGKTGRYAVLSDAGAVTPDGSKSSAYYGFPCVETLVSMGKILPQNIMNGNAISATSPHPEKAVQLLNIVWRDPYISNTLSYGVEQANYVYESGKGTSAPTVIPKSGADRTWTLWHNWVGPLFDQWNSTWNTTESLMAMKNANESGEMSKSVGVMIDVEPLMTEIAALSEVMRASAGVLNAGAMNDFDQYTAELKQKLNAAGMEKALEELNRQYEKVKGSN